MKKLCDCGNIVNWFFYFIFIIKYRYELRKNL